MAASVRTPPRRGDPREALLTDATRELRRQLAGVVEKAGVRVGPARRAVIDALTWTPGLWFDAAELEMRVRGRASPATTRRVVEVLRRARWLRRDASGRHLVRMRRD